jgi:hypothetical protein
MTVFSKVKFILGILLVFFLIVATNLVDRDNFQRVRDSVVTIYEDRLVAKDIIYELSRLMHQKELAALRSDEAFFASKNQAIDTEIDELIAQFEATRLTSEEETTFDNFEANLRRLRQVEGTASSEDNEAYRSRLTAIQQDLHSLSKIQLREGRNQLYLSTKAVDTIELFTSMEIYLLIILAIVVQVIIIYQPSKKEEETEV